MFRLNLFILLKLFLLLLVECQNKFERQQIQSYASCKTDNDCKENSFCFGNDDNKKGLCKCLDGYELERNRTDYKCLKALRIGDPCEEDFQCIGFGGNYANCVEQSCQCIGNSIENRQGLCVPKLYLSSLCLSDESCQWIENAGCEDGHCTCAYGMTESIDKTQCLKNLTLGDFCSTDNDCNIETMRCSSVCHCKTDYVTSRNSKECLKAARKFGDICYEDAQCSEFLEKSVCINNNCTCPLDTHKDGSTCVKSVNPDGACQNDKECITEEMYKGVVFCTNEVCTCKYGKKNDVPYCNLKKEDSGNAHVIICWILIIICAFITFLIN